MSLTFLLGGARSGKSALAVELARAWACPVTLIATAEPRDDDMAERIRLHREQRPGGWTTVEEPVELERALAAVPDDEGVVVDCLTLWVANLLERDRPVDEASRAAATLARSRGGPAVVISNEVGLGIVPETELGRRYRDVLGRVNSVWAAAADSAELVVAGRRLPLS